MKETRSQTKRRPTWADNLDHFTGTQEWHKFNILTPNYLLTDGALYVAENGNAFWLMDLIASYHTNPRVRAEYFQTWHFKRLSEDRENDAKVWAEDGNYNRIASQLIPYTDFELSELKLFCIQSGKFWVILLPSEY
jgi:hypothetical protein